MPAVFLEFPVPAWVIFFHIEIISYIFGNYFLFFYHDILNTERLSLVTLFNC